MTHIQIKCLEFRAHHCFDASAWLKIRSVTVSDACAYQLCTSCTDGVEMRRSGIRLISFMMLDSRTGSSCLRKAKDVFSHAFVLPRLHGKGVSGK